MPKAEIEELRERVETLIHRVEEAGGEIEARLLALEGAEQESCEWRMKRLHRADLQR